MSVNRRTFLGGVALLGAAAMGSGTLAGCSTRNTGSNPDRASGKVELPSYIPYTGVRPDAPATDTGAAPYYRTFPSNPPAFLGDSDTPMSGGSIKLLTFMNAIPKPVGENLWWQGINKALGGEITMDGAAIGDYQAKFQVMVAGGEFTDLAVLEPQKTPSLAGLLASKFQDLTDYLSGDAIKDYMGLANIPQVAWRNCVYNNGIYLIPIQRFSLKRSYLVRADLARKYGVNPVPATGQELLDTLRGLSDLRSNRWATAHVFGLLDLINEMQGTPNQWSVTDGKFTKDYETEEFEESLAIVAKVWKDNLIHPVAFEANFTLKIQDLYDRGVTPFFPGAPQWAGNAGSALKVDPSAETVAIPVPTWDGKRAAGRWLGTGAPYLTAVKKAEPERIKEVLRVVNWMSAPFGTREFMLFKYGIEGHDYTVDANGAFTTTDTGKVETPTGLYYAGSAAIVHHHSLFPDLSKAEYDSEVLAMKTAVELPTIGLESLTDQNKGASLTKQMTDLQSDIIQGRKKVSRWADGVQSWRANGGDTIRREYEKSLASKKN